jgi:hypothetical protein
MNYKQKILDKLGGNKTKPKQFDKDLSFASGLYTYRKDVFVLGGGLDTPFDDFTENQQKQMWEEIEADRFTVNPAMQ